MNNNLTLAPPEARLTTMSTNKLRRELSRAVEMTARSIAYLALVWRELERRGEDLSSLRNGLSSYLPAIADGRLAPEAVVSFAGQRSLLRALQSKSIAEQVAIAASGVVELDGVKKHLTQLNQIEIARIFAPDRTPHARRGPARKNDTKTEQAAVRLTPGEYDNIRSLAVSRQISISDLIRSALVAAKII